MPFLSGQMLLWFWCKHPNNFHRKWMQRSQQYMWSIVCQESLTSKNLFRSPGVGTDVGPVPRADTSPCSLLSLKPAEPSGQVVQEPDNILKGVFFVSLGLLLLEKRPLGWRLSGLRSNFELELRFSEWMRLLQRWQCGVSLSPYNYGSGVKGHRVKGQDIWVLGNLCHITFRPSLEK